MKSTGAWILPLNGIEYQYNAPINHVPLIERHIVYTLGYEIELRYSYCVKRRLLPEASATLHGGECVNDTKCQNAFDRA